jgi:hypothetical protein
LLNPSDFELVSPPNPPNDAEGDAPNTDFCSPFIGTDPDEDLPKLGTPLLTPPKPGGVGEDDLVSANVDLEVSLPTKPGTPLLTLLNPVGKDDLVSADVDLDLSPPKGNPPNTDFCSPFIVPSDPDDDVPKPVTPLLTSPKPRGVGEDNLVSTEVKLDLTPPPDEDPPNADVCSPFIASNNPDDDVAKP